MINNYVSTQFYTVAAFSRVTASNFGRKLIVNVRLRQIISEHGSTLVEYEFSTQEQVGVIMSFYTFEEHKQIVYLIFDRLPSVKRINPHRTESTIKNFLRKWFMFCHISKKFVGYSKSALKRMILDSNITIAGI